MGRWRRLDDEIRGEWSRAKSSRGHWQESECVSQQTKTERKSDASRVSRAGRGQSQWRRHSACSCLPGTRRDTELACQLVSLLNTSLAFVTRTVPSSRKYIPSASSPWRPFVSRDDEDRRSTDGRRGSSVGDCTQRRSANPIRWSIE